MNPAPLPAAGLAAQQQALLDALGRARGDDALAALAGHADPIATRARGLQAYRANAAAVAVRSLQAAYPVVHALLGDDNFEPLARHLWRTDPPTCGDLGRWGGGLAAAIDALPDLSGEEPWLADVARVEWALNAVATAADAVPDTPSFALLVHHDADTVALVLAPGTALVASEHAVVSVVRAHADDGPTLAEAGERLRGRHPETALVWREGYVPRLREAPAPEAAFLGACLAGASLAAALARASAFDFEPWLAPAVLAGLVTGARLLSPSSSS